MNPWRYADAHERARTLAHAWQKTVKRIKRKYKLKRFPFLAVFERTKRGEPHLHILCRSKWIDQAWLSDTMREMIGAPVVDIRRVRDRQHAAKYITKYLAKDPFKFNGTKRYWQSQDYQVILDDAAAEDPAPGGVWEIREMPLEQYAETLALNGYVVTLRSRRLFAERTPDPPTIPRHLQQRKPT